MISSRSDSHDPLPSWRSGSVREQILSFVEGVTSEDHPDFVPEDRRIAVFDSDGTLIVEYPVLLQLQFALEHGGAMLRREPDLATTESLQALAAGDIHRFTSFGKKGVYELVMVLLNGIEHEESIAAMSGWLATAKSSRYERPVTACIYQPMLELIALLKSRGFVCFVVTGGGADFVREFAPAAYGIPHHQIIGSSATLSYEVEDGRARLRKESELRSFNDREEKVRNIAHHIGLRPIFVAGNSDGDLAMMRYARAGAGASFRLLVHHDDSEREAAYDRDFPLSPLREALDVAESEGITVVSMRNDWLSIFPDL